MISSSSTLSVSTVSTVGLGTTRPQVFRNVTGQNVGHLASAWITFNNNDTAGGNAVYNDFNCVGFTDDGVGKFKVNFQNALETGYNISTSSLYAVTGTSQAGTNRVALMIDESNATTNHSATIHSTFVKMRCGGFTGSAVADQDSTYNSVIVFANPDQGYINPQRID